MRTLHLKHAHIRTQFKDGWTLICTHVGWSKSDNILANAFEVFKMVLWIRLCELDTRIGMWLYAKNDDYEWWVIICLKVLSLTFIVYMLYA